MRMIVVLIVRIMQFRRRIFFEKYFTDRPNNDRKDCNKDKEYKRDENNCGHQI